MADNATATLGEDTNEVILSFERASIKKNIIEGVHLVGLQAKNRYRANKAPYIYKESALKAAVELYNNVDIYLSHGKEGEERPIESKVGFVQNARFKEGVGIIGDLVLNNKHPFFESTVWWAENAPGKLGMSHVATNVFNTKENAVVEIRKVHSVDLVSSPSTTNGLFKEGVVIDKANQRMLELLLESAFSLISEIQYPMQGNKLPMDDRALKILPVIKDLASELKKIAAEPPADKNEPVKESSMEYKDITADEFKKQRGDLVAMIASEAVAAHTATESKVKESVKDIPAALQTELFVSLVREAVVANDDKKLTALIADRKVLVTATAKESTETVVLKTVESAAPAKPIIPATTTKKLERNDVLAAAKRK